MTDDTASDHGEPIDPLAAAWAEQDLTTDDPVPDPGSTTLVDSTAKAHRKDQLRLLWLNVQEVVPSVVVGILFTALAPSAERPPAVLAGALLVLAVAGYLVVTSVRHHRADRSWGPSVRDQVARRLAQVEHRARLYRTVAWWYFLPLLLAIALFRIGMEERFLLAEELGFWGLIGGCSIVLYLVNRWYGRTRFESKRARLRSLLAEFDDDLGAGMDDPTPNPESRGF